MSSFRTVATGGHASSPILERIVNRVFRCSHRHQTRPITLRGETFAVCLDCGQRIAYDLQAMRGGAPAQGDNPSPKIPRNLKENRFPASCTAAGRNGIKKTVNSGPAQKKTLAEGLGIVFGECVFALNGPFLLNRFGFNVPEAAAVGCVVGAAVGYGFAEFFLRIRNSKYAVSSMPAVAEPEVTTELDGARNTVGASAPTNRTAPNTKEPLIETLPFEKRIQQRANQLYVERGKLSGSQLDDWLQAEEEILHAHQDALVDEASEESFPASDPPAFYGD